MNHPPGPLSTDALAQLAELEALYDSLPVGIALLDRQLRYLRVNEALARINGVPRAEHLGRTVHEVLPWLDASLVAQVRRVIDTGCTVRNAEGRGLGPDGRPRRWRGHWTPVRDAAGQVIGASAVIEDTTEQHRARNALEQREAQLRASTRRLNAVLDNASVAIFLMDERQHCVYMNPAAERLTGFTLAETAGRPLHDVIHHTRPDGSPYPLAECAIDRAFPQNMQEQGEEVFVHRDGSFYPVAFTASPIRDEQANTVGTVIEVRDIRREKQTLEALTLADRRKDEFLAMLAHELRNPLAPLTNALRLLERAEPLTTQGAAALAMARRQAAALGRLVDDLLEVSRITRGRIELRCERLTVGAAVHQAVEAAGSECARRGQRLEAQVPREPLWVEADPVRLAQMLANLLANAAKYTPDGGRVAVQARRRGDTVEIAVADTGTGLAPDQLEQVFELFHQVDATLDRAHGGLGIGLALVKRLAALHGGHVRAASAGPGAGSTFTIVLPLSPATAQAPAAQGRRRR